MRRSTLSNAIRAEHFRETRERPGEELVQEALALFAMAVKNLQKTEGISKEKAIKRLKASRQIGRRPSKVAVY